MQVLDGRLRAVEVLDSYPGVQCIRKNTTSSSFCGKVTLILFYFLDSFLAVQLT